MSDKSRSWKAGKLAIGTTRRTSRRARRQTQARLKARVERGSGKVEGEDALSLDGGYWVGPMG